MSATNRGAARVVHDFYGTPPHATAALLAEVELPGGRWLEPCAGTGAIIRAVNQHREDVDWYAHEIRPEARRQLQLLVAPGHLTIGDWLAGPEPASPYDVIITNPPYTSAVAFIFRALNQAAWVVMLLRLNFLEARQRYELMHHEMPDLNILTTRPSYTGKGKCDATSYAWMVWPPERHRAAGQVRLLLPREYDHE